MSEDRDKRNWREIDKKKDRSAHRGEERKPLYPKRPTRASGRYKDALNKAFEAGDIGKITERLSQNNSPPEGQEESTQKPKSKTKKASRQKLIRGVKNSSNRRETTKALEEYLQHYEMPDDFDFLTRALDHPDEQITTKVLQHILELLETEKPRRSGELRGKLRIMEDDIDQTDEIKELAGKVLKEL